jgi:hypothetical protein
MCRSEGNNYIVAPPTFTCYYSAVIDGSSRLILQMSDEPIDFYGQVTASIISVPHGGVGSLWVVRGWRPCRDVIMRFCS